jgi:hypothetical protein
VSVQSTKHSELFCQLQTLFSALEGGDESYFRLPIFMLNQTFTDIRELGNVMTTEQVFNPDG